MTYRTEIDVAHDCPVSEFLTYINKFNAKIYNFIPDGPAGGNPVFTLDFDEHQSIVNFLQSFYEDDDAEFINSRIQNVNC